MKLLKIRQTGDSEGFYVSQNSFFGEIYLISFYVRTLVEKTHFQKIWKKEKKTGSTSQLFSCFLMQSDSMYCENGRSNRSKFKNSRNFQFLLNNYWMRLSMILWIIKTEVCVICRSRRLRQITQTRGFDNSWYQAKTEFNNCFIIHFSHNSSSKTEAKRSAILFLRRTLQGA